MDSAPPTLETTRLLLRAHTAADYPDSVAMWSDASVTRYTIGEPSPPQRTWMRILGYRGLWAMLGYGYWAVQERATGRYVGELGFADFKRNVHPSVDGVPELGWAISPWAKGRGYATEALRAAVAWGDARLGVMRTVCLIHRDNAASLRVAEKVGYGIVVRAATEGEPVGIFARERPGRG